MEKQIIKNCRNKKILVTGGAGFIGSNLVKILVSAGAEVLVYDNFSVGKRTFLPPEERNLSIKNGDILDAENLALALSSFSPNIVIHLAAMHFIPYCEKYPAEALRVNLVGAQNVIEACNESTAQLIFASSAAVYPISNKPLREDDQITLEGIYGSVYGVTKAAGEILIRHHSEKSKIKCLALRLFNNYGPNETNPHLIPHILEEMKKGNTINLGNVRPKRDYIYVDDTCRAIVYLFSDKNQFGIYNVGTGKEYSAEEIVKIISKKTRKRKRDRMHLLADISKITKATSWKPEIDLKKGLQQLVKYELEE
jgi:UDP-glucose 4-epimerase